MLGILALPTVTGANRRQKKYEVNNPMVSGLSMTGPRNKRQWQRYWWRTRNRKCVWGIRDLGTKMEATALRWRAWGIVNHDGGFNREIQDRVFDDNDGCVNWGSIRYNASKWKSPTVEAPVRLQDQGIDDNNGGVDRVRWAGGLSDNNGGVDRGRVICNVSDQML